MRRKATFPVVRNASLISVRRSQRGEISGSPTASGLECDNASSVDVFLVRTICRTFRNKCSVTECCSGWTTGLAGSVPIAMKRSEALLVLVFDSFLLERWNRRPHAYSSRGPASCDGIAHLRGSERREQMNRRRRLIRRGSGWERCRQVLKPSRMSRPLGPGTNHQRGGSSVLSDSTNHLATAEVLKGAVAKHGQEARVCLTA